VTFIIEKDFGLDHKHQNGHQEKDQESGSESTILSEHENIE
jgi:hypothetical protein